MIAYASWTGTKRNLERLRLAGWHLLFSATGHHGRFDPRVEGFDYALDNGAWTAHQSGKPWQETPFLKLLDRFADRAEWVVLPDVVGDGPRSLELSLRWLEQLDAYPVRKLFAVQDGHHVGHLEGAGLRFGSQLGIFIGGSTAWKWEKLTYWSAFAQACRAWCHIGRVNTVNRIQKGVRARATSFDGTAATRWLKNVPKLDHARRQTVLHFEGERA